MSIARVAHLWLCPNCSGHGRIICADGTKSRQFATQSAGIETLATLVNLGRIASDETPELRRQIEASGLEPSEATLDAAMTAIAEMEETLEDFHDTFKKRLTRFLEEGRKAPNRTVH